jgi:exodeoxyribonuclease V alpha subunit
MGFSELQRESKPERTTPPQNMAEPRKHSANRFQDDRRLRGQVDRVTYLNEENGYGVIKVKVRGYREPVPVVGNFVSVVPGETLQMEGSWVSHPEYGRQFKVERYESVAPATTEGIRKYLGSGLIKGIRNRLAGRIVDRFGSQTLEVIEHDIGRLLEVEGIGPDRLERIRNAWEEQKDVRELMVFLRSHGINTGFATRIFKQYGKNSMAVLQENPYRLAMDVYGIGFKTADQVAANLGFPSDSPQRAEAGLVYVLHQATEEGHVCIPYRVLLERTAELLSIDPAVLQEAVGPLDAEGRIKVRPLPAEARESFGDDRAVYLRGYYVAEKQAAERLRGLHALPPRLRRVDPEKALERLRSRSSIRLAAQQEEAVRQALTQKVLVVTGGPGTGKTTLIRAVLTILREMQGRVLLAAPTGRAAKKLGEAAGRHAATLHRLLEFKPQLGGFQRNEQHPLNADLIVVDEASMLDVKLTHQLMKAMPADATLVLVGDVDQLPSVGPGNVLRDVIDCGVFPVVRLTEIFRQARQSRIVMSAHAIRQGRFPDLAASPDKLQDFYFIEKDDPQEALSVILRLVTERIPERFQLEPLEEIQVLSPMHRGVVGAQRLNEELQQTLNPEGQQIQRAGRIYRVGDRVMQVRNNYDKEVFNGDLGRIQRIDEESQELVVVMDAREVTYDFGELDELVLAYAVSVHKAQGSEYPAVVLPLLTQHYVMLQRNLLYTAVTRGKKLVVVVGSKKALGIALRNSRMQERFSLLKERLAGLLTE